MEDRMNRRERFLRAANCESTDRPPVWLMRQAGRYLPEYREIREKYSFLEMCRRPELAFEVSMQPWRRFKMDAVIVFSDILIPATAMGLKLEFEEGAGPRFDRKIQTSSDVNSLSRPHIRRTLGTILETLGNLRHELGDESALLGFVGAPWTFACYLTEGGSGDFNAAVGMAKKNDPALLDLINFCADVIAEYAVEQVRAGADAVQVFDTWGGLLEPGIYSAVASGGVKKICSAIKSAGGVPILFVRDSEKLLGELGDSGAKVISIGSTTRLSDAWKILGSDIATQGNLDPELLLGSPADVIRATEMLMEEIGPRAGHIVNLGHGVLPKTRPESVKAFVDTVAGC